MTIVVRCTLLVCSGALVPPLVAEDNLADKSDVYVPVILAEVKVAQIGPNQQVCLALEHDAIPTKALQQALRARGVRIVRGGPKCSRRFLYTISIEQVTLLTERNADVSVQTLDLTLSEVDFGLILRHGTYSLEFASGEWKIVGYKKLTASSGKPSSEKAPQR